jgi:hypothetical protein
MLCLITMPLTLVEILYLTWQFGNFEVSPFSSFTFAKCIFKNVSNCAPDLPWPSWTMLNKLKRPYLCHIAQESQGKGSGAENLTLQFRNFEGSPLYSRFIGTNICDFAPYLPWPPCAIQYK